MRIPRPSHSSCSKREPVGRFHAKSARWPEPQRLLCPERPAAPDWAASCSALRRPRLSHRGAVPGDPSEVPAFTRQALGLQMDTPGPCGASRPPDLRRRRMAPTSSFSLPACPSSKAESEHLAALQPAAESDRVAGAGGDRKLREDRRPFCHVRRWTDAHSPAAPKRGTMLILRTNKLRNK